MAADPIMAGAKLPPSPGHIIQVWDADGNALSVFPVDARELCASGAYSMTPPSQSPQPVEPESSQEQPPAKRKNRT